MDRVTNPSITATGTIIISTIGTEPIIAAPTVTSNTRSTKDRPIGIKGIMAVVVAGDSIISGMEGGRTAAAVGTDVITNRSAASPRCRRINVNKSCIYKGGLNPRTRIILRTIVCNLYMLSRIIPELRRHDLLFYQPQPCSCAEGHTASDAWMEKNLDGGSMKNNQINHY